MLIEAMNASRVSALSQIQQMLGCTCAKQTDSTERTGASEEDSVTLSSEGQWALRLSSMFSIEPGKGVAVDDIGTFADRQLATFNEQFTSLLRENNIDTSQPITLGHEFGTGRVIVTNDHPEAEKIEALLEENSHLRNAYTGITSALELARHSEEHRTFAHAFAENPRMAAAQHAYLFNTRWEATVRFSADGYDIAYDRVPRH